MPRFLFLLLACRLAAQVTSLSIDPRATDPAIDPGDPHRVATLPGPLKGPLLVFLPGTDGAPSGYSLFLQTAAGFGLPVLSIAYPNAENVNTLCATSTNLDCFEQVRAEIIDGTNRSAFVDINRANSIENRLLKALQYLHAADPARGWNQYYSGGEILWHRTIISGHSQGAGHAALIAKYHLTARAVLFAGMDYQERQDQIAPWMFKPSATPPAATFGMCHQLDNTIKYDVISKRGWPAQGITAFGAIAVSESASSPYQLTRTFTASSVPPVGVPPHGVIVSNYINRMPTAFQQAVAEVWRYMLTGATLTPVNAASYATDSLAPNSLAAIFGAGIPNQSNLTLTASGASASIFATAAGQVNAALPNFPVNSPVALVLQAASGPAWIGLFEPAATAPGIFSKDFSGTGEVAGIFTSAGSQLVLTIYGTGWRAAGSNVQASLAGTPLNILFSGPQPQFAGLDQANLDIPLSLRGRRGLELTFTAAGVQANKVMVNVP